MQRGAGAFYPGLCCVCVRILVLLYFADNTLLIKHSSIVLSNTKPFKGMKSKQVLNHNVLVFKEGISKVISNEITTVQTKLCFM